MKFSQIIDVARRERDALIVKLTLAGKRTLEIAKEAECSQGTVTIVRAKHGLQGKPGRPKRSNEAKAAE